MIARLLLASLFFSFTGNVMGCDDASLQDTLVVRLSQSGFAGETGTVYTVETDGSWSARAFVNERVEPPRARGTFTGSELNELAAMIDADVFAEGERSTREPPDVNPQGILIEYGERSTTLALEAGEEIAPCGDGLDCPAVSVVAWLKAMTEGERR